MIYALGCGVISTAKISWNPESKMRRKIWAHVADLYEAAQEFDDAYYLSMTGEERLETVQILRERYLKRNEP